MEYSETLSREDRDPSPPDVSKAASLAASNSQVSKRPMFGIIRAGGLGSNTFLAAPFDAQASGGSIC